MTNKQARPRKKTAAKGGKAPKQPLANLGVSFSSEAVEMRLGQRDSRVASGAERAIEYGVIRNERLTIQSVRSAMTEVGARTERAALSLPSQLFSFHIASLPAIEDPKIQIESVIENNLASVYTLQSGEYGRFTSAVTPKETRVTYLVAQEQAVGAYARATQAAGLKPVAIEPRMISEIRAIASHYTSALLLYGEMGATYLVNLHEGDILNLQEARDLEQAVVQVGRGEGFANGVRTLYTGQDVAMIHEQLGRVMEMIDAERSYSEMLGIESGAGGERPLLLAGDFDLPGGAELFEQLIGHAGMHFESPSGEQGSLALEGLLLRARPELVTGALGINMLERRMLPAQENKSSALAAYVVPLAILGLAGGMHAMQLSSLGAQQQRQAGINQKLSEIEPQVGEQLKLQARNTDIQQELMRAEQVRNARSFWPQYLQMIARRVPDTTLIGITSLSGKRDGELQARDFDGRKVDLVFEVDVEARTRQAMQEFIRAFSTEPFAISVNDYTAGGTADTRSGRFMTARIGIDSQKVNATIRAELEEQARSAKAQANQEIPSGDALPMSWPSEPQTP